MDLAIRLQPNEPLRHQNSAQEFIAPFTLPSIYQHEVFQKSMESVEVKAEFGPLSLRGSRIATQPPLEINQEGPLPPVHGVLRLK